MVKTQSQKTNPTVNHRVLKATDNVELRTEAVNATSEL